LARKKDTLDDTQAQQVLDRIGNKILYRPLSSTGLTGDQIPSDTLEFVDIDTIRSIVRTEVQNVEVLNLLNTLTEAGGMNSSGSAPIRGTMQTKTQALTNNAVSYIDFGPGVWHITDIVVLLQGGSGTITYRAYAYDATDGNPALELVFGSNTSSTLFNFNGDSQFDHFQNQFFGETINNGSRQLGLKPSGTFDAGTMTAYVLCHRVR
jgi:hypothetical protein